MRNLSFTFFIFFIALSTQAREVKRNFRLTLKETYQWNDEKQCYAPHIYSAKGIMRFGVIGIELKFALSPEKDNCLAFSDSSGLYIEADGGYSSGSFFDIRGNLTKSVTIPAKGVGLGFFEKKNKKLAPVLAKAFRGEVTKVKSKKMTCKMSNVFGQIQCKQKVSVKLKMNR